MTLPARTISVLTPVGTPRTRRASSESFIRRLQRSGRVVVGGAVMLAIILACLITLPWTIGEPSHTTTATGPLTLSTLYYDTQTPVNVRGTPQATLGGLFGYDTLGRSILGRCLLGGAISLAVGFAAATIAVVLGVSVGLFAGYTGGWVDALLMRSVDVLYGLPYILLVILFKIALEGPLAILFGKVSRAIDWKFDSAQAANLTVMFLAIGLVSWLTMARVVRGQVLTLRELPYIEACRAMGLPRWRIFLRHVLPNLMGPIIVYATLTVPSAILQESFLSFLGVGVKLPLPTWGSMASDGVAALSPVKNYWWTLLFPCLLLMVTLLSLNFLGDGLRDLFDPKRETSKI